ncbi:MAG: c-type cytochrome [Gammaproteobacteria bacterium]|nr:c-type cytochrome [Gammaproteobacteria bacterium]
MGKSKAVSNVAAGAAVAICLSTVQVAQAGGNPFEMQTFQKGAAGQKLVQGMCGGRWGGMMEGRCGGMMEGMMMGGEMPRGVDPMQLPEPQSAGARLVNQYCTQCHGLPAPALHSAPGWSPVVGRMNARMQWMRQNSRMGIAAPTPEELKAILAYMQTHATK